MKSVIAIVLFLFFFFDAVSQRSPDWNIVRYRNDTVLLDYFWLTKGHRIRDIFSLDKVDVRFINTGSKERVKGHFIGVRGDTLYVDETGVADSLFGWRGRDTFLTSFNRVKIPNITTFYHERKKLNKVLDWSIGVSAISFVLVSPLVSINKHGFNTERFILVGGSSLAVMHVFIGGRIAFGKKKMKVVRKNKNLRHWQVW